MAVDNSIFLQLLAENHQIADIWDVGDVQSVRPDLNDDQAWQVLEAVDHEMDAHVGINWTVIEMTAQRLFPEPDTAAGEGKAGD